MISHESSSVHPHIPGRRALDQEVRAPTAARGLPASRNISGVPRRRSSRVASVPVSGEVRGAGQRPPGAAPKATRRVADLVSAPMAQVRSAPDGVRHDVRVGRRAPLTPPRPATPRATGVVGSSYVGAAGVGSAPSSTSRLGQQVAPGPVGAVGVGHLGEQRRASPTATYGRRGRRTRRAPRARPPARSGGRRPASWPRRGRRGGRRCRPTCSPAGGRGRRLAASWARCASSRWAPASCAAQPGGGWCAGAAARGGGSARSWRRPRGPGPPGGRCAGPGTVRPGPGRGGCRTR